MAKFCARVLYGRLMDWLRAEVDVTLKWDLDRVADDAGERMWVYSF